MRSQNVRSNGKLLLSGEYLVVHGAEALALPTRFGQDLSYQESDTNQISWKTLVKDETVLSASFDLQGMTKESNNRKLSDGLQSVFSAILSELNSDQLPSADIISHLDFPMNWGLGSSSTLIYALSEVFGVDAFKLLENTFGGSGYDIACASASQAILYQRKNANPKWLEVDFDPPFSEKIHFVYLNEKMNSRQALTHLQDRRGYISDKLLDDVSRISRNMIHCQELSAFSDLMIEHEEILSEFLDIQPVKKRLFPEYSNSVKSLGAWGGDFVMVLGEGEEMDYFSSRGYDTIFSYSDMIKTPNFS